MILWVQDHEKRWLKRATSTKQFVVSLVHPPFHFFWITPLFPLYRLLFVQLFRLVLAHQSCLLHPVLIAFFY
jgi:hypothetical protein